MPTHIVAPITINGTPVDRPHSNGNNVIEEAGGAMRASWQIYMQAYSEMPLHDRLRALLARITPGPKWETFHKAIGNVEWVFGMHRSPGACISCGIPLPIESHLCARCQQDAAVRKEFYGGYKTVPEAKALIEQFDSTRKNPGWLIAEVVAILRLDVLVKTNKHYVLSAYDLLKLCGFEPQFDYVRAALAVVNYGNMVPEDTDEDVRFNKDTATILRWCPYDIYLQTAHWAAVRLRALDAAGNRCQMCNTDKLLQVHHRTYANRGSEKPGDVTVLCRDCHEAFHKNGRLAR